MSKRTFRYRPGLPKRAGVLTGPLVSDGVLLGAFGALDYTAIGASRYLRSRALVGKLPAVGPPGATPGSCTDTLNAVTGRISERPVAGREHPARTDMPPETPNGK